MMNRQIEHYLTKASRGTWGKERQTIRDELQTHIEGRVNAHLMRGLSEEQAVEKAVLELGPAASVSHPMTRLYSGPYLFVVGVMAALITSLMITFMASGFAQPIPGMFYYPSETCVEAFEAGEVTSDISQDYKNGVIPDDCFGVDNSLWVDFNTVKPLFEASGMRVSGVESAPILNFAEGGKVLILEGGNSVNMYGEDDERLTVQPGYFDLWTIVKAAARYDQVELGIAGWDNPTLTIGGAELQIGTSEQPLSGITFYENYLDHVLFTVTKDYSDARGNGFNYIDILNPRTARLTEEEGYLTPNWDESLVASKTVTFDADVPTGVYGLIVAVDPDGPLAPNRDDLTFDAGTAFFISMARSTDGMLTLEMPADLNLSFVNAFTADTEFGDAMIVELSAEAGRWYEVIEPQGIRLD